MHKLLDYFNLPRTSPAGETLSFFGRLTVGWLWTDDPVLAKIHAEQDKKEGR